MVSEPLEGARRRATSGSGWYAVVARVGLVAKGISYGIVGVLAVKLAVGVGGTATSRSGALHELARHPFGKVLLILLAIGLVCYALWRLVQAIAADDEGESMWKEVGRRVGYAGRGLVYVALTVSAVKILTGAGSESQNEKAHKTTAAVLSWPAGRWLVGTGGVILVGVGLWNAYRGITRKFEKRWRRAEMGSTARTWGGRAGVAGHLARAVVFSLIGIFVVKAAIDYSPKDAIGLDGALQKLTDASYGAYLLGVTAAGLVCYGLYCLVDARFRDVSAR
jgi:hypothetical protein